VHHVNGIPPHVAPPQHVTDYQTVLLSRDDCLIALRLLAHVEEVYARFPDAVAIMYTEEEWLSVSDLYLQLDPNCPTPQLVVLLNDLIGSEGMLSMEECATQIVMTLPEATLDLQTILNTSKTCDNDALLFFQ